MTNAAPGRLYVVATPIGNLGDLSARARETLAGAALIAAEDTRHTGTLLKAFGISTPMISLHDHNEAQRAPELVERLRGGASVALVSDAGTPAISDPGFDLVRACAAAGIEVIAVPGPCALVAALSIAALPTDRFCFEGFLPARGAARRARLGELSAERRTLVFYESPHRIEETLADCAEHLGPTREAVLARRSPSCTSRCTAARSRSSPIAPRAMRICRVERSCSWSPARRPRLLRRAMMVMAARSTARSSRCSRSCP